MVDYQPEDARSLARAFRGRAATSSSAAPSTFTRSRRAATPSPSRPPSPPGLEDTPGQGGLRAPSSRKRTRAATSRSLSSVPRTPTGRDGGWSTAGAKAPRTWTACGRAGRSWCTVTAARSGPPATGTTWRARSCGPPAIRARSEKRHVTGEEWLSVEPAHQAAAEAIGAPPSRADPRPTDLLARVSRRGAHLRHQLPVQQHLR